MLTVNKKIFFLIVFIIFNFTSFGQTLCNTTTCITVSSSEDDAEEFEDGYSYIVSRDLEMVFDDDYPDTGYRGNQHVGIRFNSVDVPQGAIITKAYIQFTADPIVTDTEQANSGNNVDPCNLTIFGEAVDNATAFIEQLINISERPKTIANVTWSPPIWPTPGAQTSDQQTVDISPIIQEIVNRPGYSLNNAMAIIITGSGRRTAAAYDGTPLKAPQLCIEYEYTAADCGPDYLYAYGWQGGLDPNGNATNVEDILVKYGDATISSNTTSNTVTVNPEASLTIISGVSLTANNITLESRSDRYSSLISNGSISGTVNYNRYINSKANGNDLISAPVTNTSQTFASFAAINSNIVSNTALTTEKLFGPFEKTTGSYLTYDTAISAEANLTLDAGIGYRTASTGTGGTFTFNGDVLTGLVTTSIVNSGAQYAKWNLIGNPYPSYLKVDDGANGFLNNTNNTALIDPNSVGIYGYDSDDSVGGGGSIWTIYNLANSDPSTLIAPGQGFFVATQVGGTINFTPDMRSIGAEDDFISGRISLEENNAHLRLNLISDTNFSLTDFYFNDNSSLGLDPGYDASVFGGVAPDFAIYSHLVEDNSGIDFGIQSLAYADINDIIVPIGINAPQGEQLRVKIGESTVPSEVDIYFQDNIANSSHLLNSGDFVFTPDSDLSGTIRFYLRFTSSTLNLEDSSTDDLLMYASISPKTIFINGQLSDMATVVLYDIQGRSVLVENLDRNSYSNKIDISAISSGVYIVKLKMGSIIKTQKVIIR
jgi:hypothetical protein